MPFRPEHSLLRVEVPALHTIDTSSVENLMGMWSLFRSASNAMEDGRRLENLSWRLWNRETFCCSPESNTRPRAGTCPTRKRHASRHVAASSDNVPELSTSFDSASDSSEADGQIPTAAPEIRRRHSRGHEKHITPVDLEKIVTSITQTPDVAAIDLPTYAMPVPQHIISPPTPTADRASTPVEVTSQFDDESKDTTPVPPSSEPRPLESSSSTIHTCATQSSQTSAVVGSEDSSSTEMSTHSVVRGFTPGGMPSSYRSQTNLTAAAPTPILKTSPKYQQQVAPKKKGAMFTIGTSSGEDESSLDSHMYRSSLSESLKRSVSGKKTTFKEEAAIGRAIADSAVFESDDEDEDVSESAIEDDDDSSDWEDSDENSGPSSVNDKEMFQRVDSRPDLTSRRSLLTTLMHEPDRAKALANAASRSTPAIRRSRQSTPNGPSVAGSPEPGAAMHLQASAQPSPAGPSGQEPQMTAPQPIIMTTSNGIPQKQLALSPRTTRRNMLSTELTESLRKNLLWERQHKSTGNLAALKKRAQSQEAKILRQPPEPGPVLSYRDNDRRKFSNEYFHHGLGEYHSKGW
ncbi:DUF1752-domain-containing protein [Polychaeton citri CBS 116435]|uniref:DUF1752-domain-containing protein n=1 Tax=Polychaeton citri CBS 116435 TaxID=1314669 RepID=A0A9P4Q6H7_9PEZI|nr:DUF1752-domain-containing protein [Polychaeton citri CBS 116435]